MSAVASSSEAVTVKTTKRKAKTQKTTSGKQKKLKAVDTKIVIEKEKKKAISRSLPPKPASAYWSADQNKAHFNALEYRSLLQTSTTESIATAHVMSRRLDRGDIEVGFLTEPTVQSAWLDVKAPGITEDILYDLLWVMKLYPEELVNLTRVAVDSSKSVDHVRAILRCVVTWEAFDDFIVTGIIDKGKLYTTPKVTADVKRGDPCTCILCDVLDRIPMKTAEGQLMLQKAINQFAESDSQNRFYTALQAAVYMRIGHAVMKLFEYLPVLEIDTCKWEWTDFNDGTDYPVITAKWEPLGSFFTPDTPSVIRSALLSAYVIMDGHRANLSRCVRACLYNSGMDFGLFDIIDSYNDEPSITRLARRILGERS